jgi:type III secretory pathway component EscR
VFIGLLLSLFLVKETKHHVQHEIKNHHAEINLPSQKEIFLKTIYPSRKYLKKYLTGVKK